MLPSGISALISECLWSVVLKPRERDSGFAVSWDAVIATLSSAMAAAGTMRSFIMLAESVKRMECFSNRAS
jgi:multidrug transporter EmrE-like cation transporter